MLVNRVIFGGFIFFVPLNRTAESFLCGTLMSQSSLQNQCELFIQGSNPQIYCHLICGYATALMALMPSDRCPRSAAQVRLHLVTPCKTGTWWLAAHSPQVMPYENMHYSRCTLKNLMPNVDIQYLAAPFERGVKMNIMCLSGWLSCVLCAIFFFFLGPPSLMKCAAEWCWDCTDRDINIYSLHTWCCFHT